MRRLERAWMSVLGVALVCGAPGEVRAQSGVQLEQFEPHAEGGILNLATTQLTEPESWEVALWMNWAERLLQLSPANPTADERPGGEVVPDRLRAELLATYGVWPGVAATLALPFATGVQTGEFELSGRTADDLASPGLGDVRLIVDVDPLRLITGESARSRLGGLGLGLTLGAWLPTGSTQRLEGEGSFRFEPRLVVDFARWGFRATGNLGWHFRPKSDLFSYNNDDVIRWGLGLEAPLGLEGLSLSGVVHRQLVTASQHNPLDASSLEKSADYDSAEGLLALNLRLASGLLITLGGGRGFAGGLGEPAWRAFGRVGFVSGGFASRAAGFTSDRDGDGLDDEVDRCPYEPEDGRSARDDDGCPSAAPSLVRAQSGLSRGAQIPRLPRLPASEDEPMPDADGDGIPDEIDGCPAEAEDQDGTADLDGCPEVDDDGDGIPDADDRCPREAETLNGLDDADGCPDRGPDLDGDGIEDRFDECPVAPEVVNGLRDWDGCPEGIAGRGFVPASAAAVDGSEESAEPAGETPAGETPAGETPSGSGLVELRPLPVLPPLPRVSDRDGDGITDDDDLCPDTAEDADGFSDADGCPDTDDDGDRVADADDRCPTSAETYNGVDDTDGCPDLGGDVDGDGIDDEADVCPLEPEVVNGVRDWDGCPERVVVMSDDPASATGPTPTGPTPTGPTPTGPKPTEPQPAEPQPRDVIPAGLALSSPTQVLPPLVPIGDPDGDQLSGEDDLCPIAAEDLDGFEDSDGCPDLDDDGDGLADARDECPLRAETVNFFNDQDGCPDKAPTEVAGLIGVVESIQFKVGRSDIRPWTLPVLRRVATVMKRYPRLRLQIDGHTDSTGERERNFQLSYDRANAVRDWLIAQGIASHRMSAYGYGADRPAASNRDLIGRFTNRRVELSYTESRAGDR